ncbi:nuclease-related domain-containing protein [Peribacillus sp. NPDC097675]|uniref:nuclease-related domain-containing protein n=1 Tax=Peribacillus sp. NPDC097675 TaxID=3390618 RepID=UPI003D062418
MIIKDCEIPIKTCMLEALIRRLPSSHHLQPILTSDFNKNMAGYKGEQRVISALRALPEKEYLIFHDLRLLGTPYPFQMDILILTPYFLLILEVKNIAGEIYFDQTFNQLIRTKADGKTEAFDDPILQVDRQRQQLLAWLKSKSYTKLPVETLVVSANSSAIVRASNTNMNKKVIRKDYLLLKIGEFKGKYIKKILTPKALKKVSALFMKEHTPHLPNLLDIYKIPRESLQTDVYCPHCCNFSMERRLRKWVCRTCPSSSYDAHIPALQDYAILIKPTITNGECRRFLQLQSSSSAKNLLLSLNLGHIGQTKGRMYLLDSLMLNKWREC